METGRLAPGDRIASAEGAPLRVAALAATGRIAATYNLEVDGWRTFLVGIRGGEMLRNLLFVGGVTICSCIPASAQAPSASPGEISETIPSRPMREAYFVLDGDVALSIDFQRAIELGAPFDYDNVGPAYPVTACFRIGDRSVCEDVPMPFGASMPRSFARGYTDAGPTISVSFGAARCSVTLSLVELKHIDVYFSPNCAQK